MATMGIEAAHRDQVRILGVPIDCVTMDRTLEKIESFVRSGQPHLIVTADATSIVIAQSDPRFLQIIEAAELVTPDGSGVLWAARRKGKPFKEKVSGVDIVDRVCALSADKGYRIYFLGAAQGVAESAAEKLRLKHPGCNIVGTRHGYFPAESDAVVAGEIAATRPDILFVGMGMPRQEEFIRATESLIQAKVGLGIGGSFDVFSGKAKRAPLWVRKLHLEWMWRLIQDPKKIAKVKLLPKFAMLVLRER